jgi:hypothetical protein
MLASEKQLSRINRSLDLLQETEWGRWHPNVCKQSPNETRPQNKETSCDKQKIFHHQQATSQNLFQTMSLGSLSSYGFLSSGRSGFSGLNIFTCWCKYHEKQHACSLLSCKMLERKSVYYSGPINLQISYSGIACISLQKNTDKTVMNKFNQKDL